MATWTGIVDLETLTPDVTTDGVIITQVNAMQAGNGAVNTTLRLGDPFTGKLRVFRMNNQVITTVNPDGSPCIDFADTLIMKTTSGACFNRISPGTTPLIRFRRVAMSYLAGGTFLFMGNDNRVQTIFEDVIITFDNYGFAFFGREAIWNDVVIRGNGGGDTFPPNLPLEINGLKLYDHSTMKLEHGSGGMYSVQMLNSSGTSSLNGFYYSGFTNSTTSDQTDRCMHLLDSPLDATKCSMTQNGAIGTWRTLKGSYKTGADAGVANARLYTAYQSDGLWVDYRFAKTRNMGVNAAKYFEPYGTSDQDPAVPSAQTLRWLYLLQPGDRVRLTGFANAANNLDTTVVGKLNTTTGKYYATADRLIVSNSAGLVAEGSKPVTLTRLEPISDASGNFQETRLEIGFARALASQGVNGYNSTFTLANYQSGAQVGVAGQTFKRESWETYLIPPYPYRREIQQWTIPQSAPSLGAKVEWNVLAVQDSSITETNAATVLAYTVLDTPQKAYDYKEAWKRIDPNTLVGGVRENFFTRSDNTLDFGSWNVVIDATATVPLAVNAGTRTLTLDAVTFVGNITTTGTVTLANGAKIKGIYADASGSSAQLNLIIIPLGSRIIVIDGSGNVADYVASSDADYTLNIPPGSVGTWKWVVKAPGYEHAKGTFMPSIDFQTTVSPNLVKKLNTDGSDMYQGTTSSLISVSFSGSTSAYIDIGNGIAPLQATFDESEDALCTQSGMIWLSANRDDLSQFNSAGGDFLFLTSGWRLRRASSGDTNATIQAFVQSVDGIPVDEVNGPVRFLTSDSPTSIAAAVRIELASELAKINAIPSNLTVINDGVKKASLSIPHNTNL